MESWGWFMARWLPSLVSRSWCFKVLSTKGHVQWSLFFCPFFFLQTSCGLVIYVYHFWCGRRWWWGGKRWKLRWKETFFYYLFFCNAHVPDWFSLLFIKGQRLSFGRSSMPRRGTKYMDRVFCWVSRRDSYSGPSP